MLKQMHASFFSSDFPLLRSIRGNLKKKRTKKYSSIRSAPREFRVNHATLLYFFFIQIKVSCIKATTSLREKCNKYNIFKPSKKVIVQLVRTLISCINNGNPNYSPA